MGKGCVDTRINDNGVARCRVEEEGQNQRVLGQKDEKTPTGTTGFGFIFPLVDQTGVFLGTLFDP